MNPEDITVDLANLLTEHSPHTEIGYLDEFTFSYSAGYIRIQHNVHNGGSSDFCGVHHPNDGFCEPGRDDYPDGEPFVCTWCGRTVW